MNASVMKELIQTKPQKNDNCEAIHFWIYRLMTWPNMYHIITNPRDYLLRVKAPARQANTGRWKTRETPRESHNPCKQYNTTHVMRMTHHFLVYQSLHMCSLCSSPSLNCYHKTFSYNFEHSSFFHRTIKLIHTPVYKHEVKLFCVVFESICAFLQAVANCQPQCMFWNLISTQTSLIRSQNGHLACQRLISPIFNWLLT